MRGWRVTLAKQAGVPVEDLRVVKTEKPRSQRSGAKSLVVLTYELRVTASEPCVSPHAAASIFSAADLRADWLVAFVLDVLAAGPPAVAVDP